MSEIEAVAPANTPVARGKARITVKRTDEILYAGASSPTIKLNGKQVADIAVGGVAIVDVPAILTASAWSYPGEFSVKLDAVEGETQTLVVAPCSANLGPSLLDPVGAGLIDIEPTGARVFEARGLGAAGPFSTAAINSWGTRSG